MPTHPPREDAAAIVGIDWGTTHRRVTAFDAQGRTLRRFSDDEGMLHAAGRFRTLLDAALARVAPLAPQPRVLLAGMVGSANGWHEVPYLDAGVPLEQLGQHLFDVPDAPPDVDCRIVPGLRWRDERHVDVMRGEETQLLGAVAQGRRDGVFVLPGTHSKWVRLYDGRIERFATYMSGELFATLSQHGTLAALMHEAREDEAAFMAGLVAATQGALSNVLFECRAKVVTGALAAASARDHLSGILIGSEWHDAWQRFAGDASTPVYVIGSAELAPRYQRAARHWGVALELLDAEQLQHAAWRTLGGLPSPSSTGDPR